MDNFSLKCLSVTIFAQNNRTMAQLTSKQKKEWAKVLYVKENLTQKEIADKVGSTRQSVSRWISEGKWEELKVGMTLTTETYDTGKQALGTVHKAVEDELA